MDIKTNDICFKTGNKARERKKVCVGMKGKLLLCASQRIRSSSPTDFADLA